ncbi:MAG: outer membrane protein assembly factor BamE [Rhizobiales bacterium]|nr:outer membrane protein assembly factor BamE [Hyphomicrobiales bacterium]
MYRILLIIIILNITSCSTVVENRGYIFNPEIQEKISQGMDKSEIISLLGTPSTISESTGLKYYYISNKFLKYAFLNPQEIERTIQVISFDENENVKDIEEYTLKDGRIIVYNNDRTIPKGTEATIIQDLFDNTGRYTSKEAIAGSIF